MSTTVVDGFTLRMTQLNYSQVDFAQYKVNQHYLDSGLDYIAVQEDAVH